MDGERERERERECGARNYIPVDVVGDRGRRVNNSCVRSTLSSHLSFAVTVFYRNVIVNIAVK